MRIRILAGALALLAGFAVAAQGEEAKLRLKPGLWEIPTQIKVTLPPAGAAAGGNDPMQKIMAYLGASGPISLPLKACIEKDGKMPQNASAKLQTVPCDTSIDTDTPSHSMIESLCNGPTRTSSVVDVQKRGDKAVSVSVVSNITQNNALLYSVNETMAGKWTAADCGDCAGKGTCNFQEAITAALQKGMGR